MISEGLIRVDAIDAAFAIADIKARHPSLGREAVVRTLRKAPIAIASLPFADGFSVFDAVSEVFMAALSVSRVERLRRILEALIMNCRPFWSSAFIRGRESVLHTVTVDVIQCMTYAKLAGAVLDDDAVQWWDRVAGYFRKLRDLGRLEAGRAGERLTLEYERRRLLALGPTPPPAWISLENNDAGYDVMSFDRLTPCRHHDAVSEIFIEVKASQFSPPRFFISRNEWEAAVRYGRRYYLHVWGLDTKELYVLNFDMLKTHIPYDRGHAKWSKLKINLPQHHARRAKTAQACR